MNLKSPSIIKQYKERIQYYSHTDEKYDTGLKGMTVEETLYSVKFLDTCLRMLIGKTSNKKVALCSHRAIIDREFPEATCRVCHRDLSKVYGRCNDYLVLRHPNCNHPICYTCMKKRPDEFYIAFKKGLDKYNNLMRARRI